MWIVANFKQNPKTANEVRALSAELAQLLKNDFADKLAEHTVAVAPSFVHLALVAEGLTDGDGLINSTIALAVQDVSAASADTGPFTGEVSAAQVADMGATFAIIGHSERRALGDVDFLTKINNALSANLTVIFCVGENLDDYKAGATLTVLQQQLDVLLQFDSLTPDETKDTIIVAYEPVWAIGTGRTPTNNEIADICGFIKQKTGRAVLYGGSVNELNAEQLGGISQVDGVLVGGASLNAQKFVQIVGAFIKR